MSLVLWLFRLYTMSPAHASYVAADGEPVVQEFLVHVCRRESGGCRRIGIHKGDAWASHRLWRRAIAHGTIDPERCPFHRDPSGWSTRGAHGQMAALSWRYLPAWLWCAPPSIFDIPWVSARAASTRAQDICNRRGACSIRALDRVWGLGNEPDTTFAVAVTEAELRVIEAGVRLVSAGARKVAERRIAQVLLAQMKDRARPTEN